MVWDSSSKEFITSMFLPSCFPIRAPITAHQKRKQKKHPHILKQSHSVQEKLSWLTIRLLLLCHLSCEASSYVPCIGRPSCERMRIQWSDMLRITRGCKATETLPVTPEAITLGLATDTCERGFNTVVLRLLDDLLFPRDLTGNMDTSFKNTVSLHTYIYTGVWCDQS